MKKDYSIPTTEIIVMNSLSVLSASGVIGDNGIGFGGIDDGGIVEPQAPPTPPVEITPEMILGLPF